MISRLGSVCLSLVLALGCAGGSPIEPKRIRVGDTAPEFMLSDIFSSENVNSAKIVHNHNATVVIIWSMACPSCREAFLKGEGIEWPTLWDGRRRVVKKYKALDYTFSIFVVDRTGTVILAQYDHPPDLAEILAETLDQVLEQRLE
jgi:hypothetical protein